jgi:hypothetical protein
MRRVFVAPLIALIPACLLIGGAVGFAASLALTPKALAVFTSASSVPISTCTLTPAADTYAYQGSSGSNFGTATTLHVRSAETGFILTSPDNKRSFARFDLASCSIPTSARVLTATMRLFMSTAPSATRTYQVHRVTQAWGETTLDWDNQPTAVATATASAATGTTSNVTIQWNVLADVNAFVAGTTTNQGWRVRDSVETSSTDREGRFNAREHSTVSQRPSLAITYYP